MLYTRFRARNTPCGRREDASTCTGLTRFYGSLADAPRALDSWQQTDIEEKELSVQEDKQRVLYRDDGES